MVTAIPKEMQAVVFKPGFKILYVLHLERFALYFDERKIVVFGERLKSFFSDRFLLCGFQPAVLVFVIIAGNHGREHIVKPPAYFEAGQPLVVKYDLD